MNSSVIDTREKPSKVNRIYYLDAMRSVLMLLGVFLHTGRIFDTKGTWHVSSVDQSSFFDALVYFIHVFRMPAFFIVSGFFCLMTIQRYGPIKFLRVRVTRILVPIITVALLLNTAQTYIVYLFNGGTENWMEFYKQTYIYSLQYWVAGEWDSHLWFLNYLVVYFLLAFALSGPLGKLWKFLELKLPFIKKYFLDTSLLFLVFPLVDLLFTVIFYQVGLGGTILFGFLDLVDVVHYGWFFLLGMYFFSSQNSLAEFSKPKWWVLFFALMCGFLLWYVLKNYEGRWVTAAMFYVNCLHSIVLSSLVFFLFNYLFSGPSKIFSYLSDASYSTYLVHHILVIGLGILFYSWGINIYVKYLAIVTITISVALFLHSFLINRVKLLRFMFNGK